MDVNALIFMVPGLSQNGNSRCIFDTGQLTLLCLPEGYIHSSRHLFMCFNDYKKAFDCVDDEILWVILRGMGVPVHLIVLMRRLCTNQEASVRKECDRDVSSHHCYSIYTQKTK